MDGRRPDERLTERSLEREIEAALDVDPSPEFVARVRTRVAQEPPAPAWRLSFGPLAAAAAVFIAATVVWQVVRPLQPARPSVTAGREPPPLSASSTGSDRLPGSTDTGRRPSAGTPASGDVGGGGAGSGSDSRRRAAVEQRSAADPSQPSQGADVLIDPADGRAFQLLLARLGDPELSRALDAAGIAVEITPIDPVPEPERPEGGVE
jgi:hypothetical protein